jgi:DNA-binding NarL/FixJ family response regulator
MSQITSKRRQQDKKKIIIVDDHPILRRGLVALIEFEPDLSVCGETATCHDALEMVQDMQPDLALVDLELIGCHGLDLIKAMKTRHPTIPALVLSMHQESVYAGRALRAGARGYISKLQLDETLLAAIRRVLAGEMYMSEKLVQQFARKYVGGQMLQAEAPMDVLSDRELQVFRLIGQGRSTRQIGEVLTLSIKTIESHAEHIKHKLTLASAPELAQRATQWVETGHIK